MKHNIETRTQRENRIMRKHKLERIARREQRNAR